MWRVTRADDICGICRRYANGIVSLDDVVTGGMRSRNGDGPYYASSADGSKLQVWAEFPNGRRILIHDIPSEDVLWLLNKQAFTVATRYHPHLLANTMTARSGVSRLIVDTGTAGVMQIDASEHQFFARTKKGNVALWQGQSKGADILCGEWPQRAILFALTSAALKHAQVSDFYRYSTASPPIIVAPPTSDVL